MRILGLETSCDETAAAVVEDGRKILSNIIATSSQTHAKTGGIIPEQAARAQVQSIIPVLEAATTKSKCQITNIDAIAITIGPGLIGSLLVGTETTKTLAYLWKKPIIPINHLIGHIYANFIRKNAKYQKKELPKFPALALVVSGGHTDLVLMSGHGKIKWLGGTRDDAAGEAFDKIARLLGLPYPGGPAIAAEADKCQIPNDKLRMLPRPMLSFGRAEENLDWSFSGLKTAVLQQTGNGSLKKKLGKNFVPRMAAETQEAIVEVLVCKSIQAVKKYQPKSFFLAGGVSANTRLRQKFQEEFKKHNLFTFFHVPSVKLCTDNAAFIASAAFFNYQPIPWQKIRANPNLTIKDF